MKSSDQKKTINVPILGLYDGKYHSQGNENSGRIVVFGDSTCLDTNNKRKDDCFWLFKQLLDYTNTGIIGDELKSSLILVDNEIERSMKEDFDKNSQPKRRDLVDSQFAQVSHVRGHKIQCENIASLTQFVPLKTVNSETNTKIKKDNIAETNIALETNEKTKDNIKIENTNKQDRRMTTSQQPSERLKENSIEQIEDINKKDNDDAFYFDQDGNGGLTDNKKKNVINDGGFDRINKNNKINYNNNINNMNNNAFDNIIRPVGRNNNSDFSNWMILFPVFVIILLIISFLCLRCKSTRKVIKNNKYVSMVRESINKSRDSIHSRFHARNARMRYSRDESSDDYSKIV